MTYLFKYSDRIGSEGAEEDDHYLKSCFLETPDLNLLQDVNQIFCIVLGRTGVGKTALLQKLERNNAGYCIRLEPELLGLEHIENSGVIKRMCDLGVRPDLFFKYFWQKILVLELLKLKCAKDIDKPLSFFNLSPDSKRRKEGRKFIENLGKDVWQEANVVTSNEMQKIEEKVNAQGSLGIYGAKAGASSNHTEAQENHMQKEHLQKIIDGTKISELASAVEFLSTDLFKKQPSYFILIDRLDENWAENPVKYKLLKSLMETIKEWRVKIKPVKVVIALRADLLDRVIKSAEPGFQPEKLRPFYLQIKWDKKSLTELIDKRISHLTNGRIKKWEEISPAKYNSTEKRNSISSINYMIERTHYRPRDLIEFVNFAISHSKGKKAIGKKEIAKAENDYSDSRWASLRTEWGENYPGLIQLAECLLKRTKVRFKVSSITKEKIENAYLSILNYHSEEEGALLGLALEATEQTQLEYFEDARNKLLNIFYRTGIIEIKSNRTAEFLHTNGGESFPDDMKANTEVRISPIYRRALKTRIANK